MNRIDTLKTYIEENPEDPFYVFALAKEFSKQNEVSDALETYQTLVQKFPNYTGTYYHYGELLWDANQPERAKAVMEKGLEVCRNAGDKHALGELQVLYDSFF